MKRFNGGINSCCILTLLCTILLIAGCATMSGSQQVQSCRYEKRQVTVNDRKEEIQVKVCKRQEEQSWDTPPQQ